MPRTTHGHVLELELPVSANGIDGEVEILVKYDYTPGSPAYTPRGEYAPIDPPEPPDINVTDLCVRDWLAGSPVWRTAEKWEWEQYADLALDCRFDDLCANAENE